MLISTTLPVEPGVYLFCGSYEGHQLPHAILNMRAEVVRVHRTTEGKLSYVGNDFMYSPSKVIGSWIRIDELENELKDSTRSVYMDHMVRVDLPKLLMKHTWGGITEETFVRDYTPYAPEAEKKIAALVFAKAIQQDILVPRSTWDWALNTSEFEPNE